MSEKSRSKHIKRLKAGLQELFSILLVLSVVISVCVVPLFIRSMLGLYEENTATDRKMLTLHTQQSNINEGAYERYVELANYTTQLEARIVTLEEALAEYIAEPMEPTKYFVPAEVWAYEDLVYAARLVAAEARGEPKEVQLAVAQCVWDRLHCTTYDWGSTIREVIDRPGQFTGGVYQGDMSDYPFCMEAVISVFYGGYRQYEDNVIYFYNPYTANPSSVRWFETLPLIDDCGTTVFRGM